MNLMSGLIRAFISRQREYRADAISVRLTRDPLSLAEALKLIETGWRGHGTQIEQMQSIFIVNPVSSDFDEREGFFSDMFTTHPPIKSRIAILADMAHLDEKTLEENLKNFKRVSPAASAEVPLEEPAEPSEWFVLVNQAWQGPFSAEALKGLPDFKPEAWVRPQGQTTVKQAFEFGPLLSLFRGENQARAEGEHHALDCPNCRVPLSEISYEGAPVLKCSHCQGVFVDEKAISRILIRRDKEFSPEVRRLADLIIKERDKFTSGIEKHDPKNAWVLDCPKCRQKLRRQYFVYSYPVEIDRCISGDGIWFDRQELEILQYIYENKERFFDDTSF
jgi:LSD1 subclass zinc finger protein